MESITLKSLTEGKIFTPLVLWGVACDRGTDLYLSG